MAQKHKKMTPTEQEDAELSQKLDQLYKSENYVIKTVINPEHVIEFCQQWLKKISYPMQVSRPLQIYWSVTTIVTACKLLGKSHYELFQALIKEFDEALPLDFKQQKHQYANVMNGFGIVLARKLLNLPLPSWKTAVQFLMSMRNEDGSFKVCPGGESDQRSTYAAVVIGTVCRIKENAPDLYAYLFKNTVQYLLSTRKASGGYGGAEAHASYTYCSLAALKLLGQKDLENDEATIVWLLNRQTTHGGFNGRPNKLPDGCYTFWCCASLYILRRNSKELINIEKLQQWVCNACQTSCGLRDKPFTNPDAFHSCYVLLGWLCANNELIQPELGIPNLSDDKNE